VNRKEFIQTCAFSCLGAVGVSAFLTACTPTKYLQVNPENDRLKIAKSEFLELKKNKARRYVIVKTARLDHPVIIYRFSESEYSALLLQCTHQGNELNVNGDLLTCPAHGSEFGNKGEVVQGPAEQKLQSFLVSTDANNIYIQLT